MTKTPPAPRKKTAVATKPAKHTSKDIAKFALRPSANTVAVVNVFNAPFGELDTGELIRETQAQITAIQQGDMSNVEAMLYGQALALQSIFVAQARRAQVQERLPGFQAHFNLALKAQAQCRATLEALAEVKNPKATTFVSQQNNAHQQQVNNGDVKNNPMTHAHGKDMNQSNELLEAQDGERLDTRTTSTASGSNPHMETVGAIQRAGNGSGQGSQ